MDPAAGLLLDILARRDKPGSDGRRTLVLHTITEQIKPAMALLNGIEL